jgi:Ca2+/Na+ antiporter
MRYIIPIIIAGILIAILTSLKDTFGNANGALIFISFFGFSVPLCAFLFLRKVIKASQVNVKRNSRILLIVFITVILAVAGLIATALNIHINVGMTLFFFITFGIVLWSFKNNRQARKASKEQTQQNRR